MKKHIESFHEWLSYACYQCDYKANMSHFKQYVKLVHEIYVTTKQPEKYIFSATIYTCYNVTIFKGGTLVNFPKIWKRQKNKKEAVQNLLKMTSIGAANTILSQDSRRMSTSTIRQFMTKWRTGALKMIMRQHKRTISTSISSLSTKESSTPALNVNMRP